MGRPFLTAEAEKERDKGRERADGGEGDCRGGQQTVDSLSTIWYLMWSTHCSSKESLDGRYTLWLVFFQLLHFLLIRANQLNRTMTARGEKLLVVKIFHLVFHVVDIEMFHWTIENILVMLRKWQGINTDIRFHPLGNKKALSNISSQSNNSVTEEWSAWEMWGPMWISLWHVPPT